MCFLQAAIEDVAEEEQLVDDRTTPDASNQPDTEAQELHGSFAPEDADNDDHSQDGESAENSDDE